MSKTKQDRPIVTMEHNLEVGAADFTAHAHPPRSAHSPMGKNKHPHS